jgi:CBS domain-containing protein
MALVIYDQGYRIQTPVRALFKPGGVDILEPIKALHPVAGEEQRVDAEGERFTLPEASTQARARPAPRDGYAADQQAGARQEAPQLRAAQIMTTPVHRVSPDTRAGDARERMRRLNIEHLVVVSDAQRPLGMISASDLQQARLEPRSSVASIYSRHLLAASPETDVSHLAASFVEFGIGAMPIVDSHDALVGIVTRTDLLRLLISGAHIERWA